MKILITTTMNKNMTEANIMPICMVPIVEEIFYVSDAPGPYFQKVRYFCVPGWILRITGKNPLVRWACKFIICFYIALVKRPDLVMGYGLIPHGINAAIIGNILNIPSCVNFMGGRFLIANMNRILKPIASRLAASAAMITVTGSDTKELVSSIGLDADSISIIPSTIDTKRFFNKGLEKKYDVIVVSEFKKGKRIDLVLEIVNRLKKSGLDIKAAILGDGSLRKSLEVMSNGMGLGENVSFLGFRHEVENYLNMSRVFLLTTEHEGLSLAMLEAMSCGAVPVVSDVDNLKDAVKGRFNGRLVKKGDIDGFVEAVSGILKDNNIYKWYSENAEKTIKSEFTNQVACKRWECAFKGIHSRRVFHAKA